MEESKQITNEDLINMLPHEIFFYQHFIVIRVVGGWIYQSVGSNTVQTFVQEPEPKFKGNFKNFEKENTEFQKYWVIDYQDKNREYRSKFFEFKNETHKLNWENKWESYGNKIIGYHLADSNGNLIDPEVK